MTCRYLLSAPAEPECVGEPSVETSNQKRPLSPEVSDCILQPVTRIVMDLTEAFTLAPSRPRSQAKGSKG
jgi:hypothetical protein